MSLLTKHLIRLISLTIFFISTEAIACTSAIVGADMTVSGRPLLWKHRDTDTYDNKIEYVEASDGQYGYVALFNAADSKLEEAWMGMNEVGFAIMNTASYNIKDDNLPQKEMDKEGEIMTIALKSCESVDDFQALLDSLPRPMGVEANFGVIDAWGNGAYFETNNHSYIKFDIKNSENHILIRTNYSHSGRDNEGYGFIREANTAHLLEPYIEKKEISPEIFTETLSRSFWHSLFEKDFSVENTKWVIDQDFIPRYKSTATIVIEGCHPLKEGTSPSKDNICKEYIMWTGLGYPPCSEIIPVWCSSQGVDTHLRGLRENGHSYMGDIVKKRRAEVFPFHKGNGEKYIDMERLFNVDGTGYVQTLVPKNLEIYKKVKEKRDSKQRAN